MNPIKFKHRWLELLASHRELQDEPLLRPLIEHELENALVITYAHNATTGWSVAFHKEGIMVKAYDTEEITPFTFNDVRPQFVLPTWAYEIYMSNAWESEKTTTFKYATSGSKTWETPWLALPWLPIDAHDLLEPTDEAVVFWADWFGRPDLAQEWIDRLNR